MSISFDKIIDLSIPEMTNDVPDLKGLKKDFDFESYLIQECGEITRRSKNYIMFKNCPICGHKDCFGYHRKTNRFKCFGANGNVSGSIIDFLIHAKNMSLKEAIEHFTYDLCGLPKNKKEAKLKENVINLIKGISEVQKADDYIWVLKNILAKGFIGILFGEGGCGKTWLLLSLCLQLTNGKGNWCGVEITKKQKVLLLEGDAPNTLIKNRINKLNISLNDECFKFVNRIEADKVGINLSLSTTEGRNCVEEIIAGCKPDLVIVDTLISFIDDEKDAEKIKIIVDELRKFASKYNCHVLICHHSRKRESGEKRKKLDQSDVIGSSIITRLASIVMGVDKYE